MTTKKKRGAGRPFKYTEEIAEEICELLIEGESLRTICSMEKFPSRYAVFRWLQAFPEFEIKYRKARAFQQEMICDDILEIADDDRGDLVEGINGNVIVQRAKLKIDARRWTAEKLAPKVYGNKQAVDHSSTDGSMTPKTVVADADALASIAKKL